ncbi:hypothetical protein [Enterobacter sp.]|uniref:hypothetical protein n=1 Tax=Enterobacter sp. TaxID=42895 RepID=UPI00296FD48F|nr:hypothetical protein [Enterobacter sp.]
MNFVYFKAENHQQDNNTPVNLVVEDVVLMRDGEVIAGLGDIKITRLPLYVYRAVPTGFRKIEYKMKTTSHRRILFSAGYLKTGDYYVETPDGEQTMNFNALSGLWTGVHEDEKIMDNHAFLNQGYAVLRPVPRVKKKRSELPR